jgi:multidrug efflux pump subunit AcrA (membrane-fusion protein)
LRLVQTAGLEARIGLPPEEASRVEIGERVTLDVGGRRFEARVSRLLPELDRRTRTRALVLRFTDAHAELVPGRVVKMEHESTIPRAGFWLPRESLARGDRGLWSVFVVVPGGNDGSQCVERRDVELMYTENNRVLVRGTLLEGERVVARGTHRIVAGQRVQTVDARPGSENQS